MTDLIHVQDVSKTFPIEGGVFRSNAGSVRAVDRVSMTLQAGATLGVVGESGSGKTTLGKMLCRLIRPDNGSILVDGVPLGRYSRQALSRTVQMVFQDPFASLNPKLTIGTILFEAAGHLARPERREKVERSIGLVGMNGDILSAYPHQFSGGQRQRIALARALIKEPKLIVADEPLSSLDISIQNQMLALFAGLKERLGLTMVFISHDLVAASNVADRLIVMKEGSVVEEGDAQSVISAPRHPYTQKLLAALPL